VSGALRSGVSKAHRYEPDINPSYRDLAEHSGVAVLAARSRKPKDKAKVEVGVQVVERWILAVLRNRQFSRSANSITPSRCCWIAQSQALQKAARLTPVSNNATSDINDLSFDERLSLMVDRELTEREDARLTTRLKTARLRHNACLEDIDYRTWPG
jgi:hypothetical protein